MRKSRINSESTPHRSEQFMGYGGGCLRPQSTTQESEDTLSSLIEFYYPHTPIGLLPLLTYHLEKRLLRHHQALKLKGLKARKFYIHLHCQNEHLYHLIEVNPGVPPMQPEELMTLIERRLLEIDLENPIVEVEVETIPSSAFRPHQVRKASAKLISGIYSSELEDLETSEVC